MSGPPDLDRLIELAASTGREERYADALVKARDERAQLRADLARVTAERDALLAGRWAGPWEGWDGGQRRHNAVDSVVAGIRKLFDGDGWRWGVYIGSQETSGTAATTAEAMAAADAALRAAGWWLAETPAGQHPDRSKEG